MTSPIETMKWLAVQYQVRATEDPEPHTEKDAKEVEAAREAFTAMHAALRQAIDGWPQWETDEPVNGGDMVEWFGQWIETVREAVAKAEGALK